MEESLEVNAFNDWIELRRRREKVLEDKREIMKLKKDIWDMENQEGEEEDEELAEVTFVLDEMRKSRVLVENEVNKLDP